MYFIWAVWRLLKMSHLWRKNKMKKLQVSTISKGFTLVGEVGEPSHKDDANILFTILCSRISAGVYNDVQDMMEKWEIYEENLKDGFLERYWRERGR